MIINISSKSGFCPGVRRADSEISNLLKTRQDAKIYTLGDLIHNRPYVSELERRGASSIEASDIENCIINANGKSVILVTRAHGITVETEMLLNALRAKYKNFQVIDMTCPFVKRIHRIAEENTGENTYFLLYATKNHPEAIGIMSHAKGEKLAFSDFSEIENLDIKGKLPILCSQTTQNFKEFEKIKKKSKKLYTNAIFFDTICNVAEERQAEAVRIAEQSDIMIVIGSEHSSNSKKLYELCKSTCSQCYFVETPADLPEIKGDALKVGITAGASTPDSIITEVKYIMENNFSEMLEESFKTLHTGETVTGTIFAINNAEIKLDLGTKVTGVLTKEQITDDPSVKLSELFKIGDELEVFVIRVEDGKGIATVSKKRVDADNSWVVLKEAFDNQAVVTGKIVSVVKGGVILAAENNTVFVPASQTGLSKGADLSTLVGTMQNVKLLEFDERKKKALGSIKVILNEEKRAKEAEIWAGLAVGNTYVGKVKNLTSYGAFVDIGGVDGMVHNSELSWKKIKHPSQVVSVGQEIEVYIKELDVENKKISLGYKTEAMDTWTQFAAQFKVGDVVPAKIVSIMPFGAFAEVFEGVDGLIHISRISTERINSPADVLTVGQMVDVMITAIDNENRKLSLSIRAIAEAAERAAAAEARAAAKAAAEAEAKAEAERLAEERAEMAPYIVGTID